MRLILSARALADLREATEFIANDDPEAAKRIANRLREAATLLAEFPHLGEATSKPGRRVFSVAGTPFRLIYRSSSGRLTILRIWHGARGWPPTAS